MKTFEFQPGEVLDANGKPSPHSRITVALSAIVYVSEVPMTGHGVGRLVKLTDGSQLFLSIPGYARMMAAWQSS